MVRTQILLSPTHYHFLKKRSKETGESISSIVRRSIDLAMAPIPEAKDKALALLGAFEADVDDASVRHDFYLGRGEPE